jgi:hypothetical protein
VRLVDQYGWWFALLLGSVACFRLAPNQSAAILRVAEFLFIGFSFAAIGEIVWHMFTMRFDGSLGLYLGLRYFVIAAIFGAVITVSSGSEPAPTAVSNVELKACRLDTVGPFPSCSVDIERPEEIRSIGEKYLDGSKTWGSGLIVLVGSADNQRLNHSCMKQFGNNAELARRRADEVLSGLQNWFSDHEGRRDFTIMVSGPRFMDTATEERGKERSVDEWVVWNWDGRGPKPSCQ